MTIETQRKNIVHRILDIDNPFLLSKIENLLDEEIFTFKVDGSPLTKKEYETHITSILKASEEGEKNYSTKEVRKNILKK